MARGMERSGIDFGPGINVELYDPVPMSPDVTQGFFPTTTVDAIGISCALAPPDWVPEQLTGLLAMVRADDGALVIGNFLGRGHAMEAAAAHLERLAQSGLGTFERRSHTGYHAKYAVDVLVFVRHAHGPCLVEPATAPAPRSIALFAAVPTQPPAGSLPPMPTAPRGEPFWSVTTRAGRPIYGNGFPGVYAI
jgi:hypothetical protein